MTDTVRVQDNVWYLPRFLKRKKVQVVDGEMELAVAYNVHQLLAPLPPTSQARVLQHVSDIFEEREKQLEQFENNLRGVE